MNLQQSPLPRFEQDSDLHRDDRQHRDACALICAVRKGAKPTHGNVKRTIEALTRMGHRSGAINGEGDGVGIMTDIPRLLWRKRLEKEGLRASVADGSDFWVAHIMIATADHNRKHHIINRVLREISQSGLHHLYDNQGDVNRRVLGPIAEQSEPVFWQIAGQRGQVSQSDLDLVLFELQKRIEDELGVHVASFSTHSVIYKVQGNIEILRRYYPELRDPDFESIVTMGHARYSTNTNPIFERSQPFNIIGHNGEFNTISRFRLEADMLDIALSQSNSDSQDIDRVVHALCMRYGLDLIEAMEYIFPAYEHDLMVDTPEIHAVYRQMRQAFGPFAQGPAAIAARFGNSVLFSVDALGLRPLWFGETEKEYFASSERGVYPMHTLSGNPKPLAPNEKIALRIHPRDSVDVLDYPAIQEYVYQKHLFRVGTGKDIGNSQSIYSIEEIGEPQAPTPPRSSPTTKKQPQTQNHPVEVLTTLVPIVEESIVAELPKLPWNDSDHKINAAVLSGMGWERYQVNLIHTMTENGKEQIGSLGWDGPLAALSQTRVNIADYFKETVAVVTNPAIDREREQSQFSTRTLLGTRPPLGAESDASGKLIQLEFPLLLDSLGEVLNEKQVSQIAHQHGTLTIQQVASVFGETLQVLSLGAKLDEPIEAAIERLQHEAISAAQSGALCLLLDDTAVAAGDEHWLDPILAAAAIDKALRQADAKPNLRRQIGIIIRSGGLRDLHDLMLCLSFGANAVIPYAMYAVAGGIAPKVPRQMPLEDELVDSLQKFLAATKVGLEKVISTVGCHELRGYGHSFSSIGLSKSVTKLLGTPNYFGSDARGVTWANLKQSAEERAAEFRGEVRARLHNPDRFYPKMWKKAEAVAHGELSLEEYTESLLNLEAKLPVSIRHILRIKAANAQLDPKNVDLSVGDYDMPVLISAMSFGSQGELAYRAYAEAAKQLNIVCINGEGGEMHDMMGKYTHNRGQQVASARFGVNIGFLNSAHFIEIKIGQGAKPGEGGHLPGFKVTPQIAEVRHTMPGVGLISPSNNHDLYSIEDLAQLIDELKTANPEAKISVKIPVVPGVGIIAVGIAKAGADVITVTGYTGGTGAARAHALRHVGLPAEVGVWLAHRALVGSGLRNDVELWVDGGMKSGRDVVKMLCLGANRVGFGTLAMVAVGCTICRGCHEGTCHVGITTHVQTADEAERKGFKAFRPFEERGSADTIVTMFNALADDIRKWTAYAGVENTQDLVGRVDLLEQKDYFDEIDLTNLLRPAVPNGSQSIKLSGRRVTRNRNIISKQITDVVSYYTKRGDYELTYDDEQVMAMDRALGTHLAGAMKRGEVPNAEKIRNIYLSFSNSAIPGNGLGAFNDAPINIMVEGGAQDGVAKCARGGKVFILKGLNHNGNRLDGSVGKSFAYGAQGGLLIVQGDADTRACIRLSGADVIFGGEVQKPLQDELGSIGARSNLKGYAFEYMTSGRAMVLGDPGPWICAGMTGGTIYQRIQPEMGLTEESIQRRIAPGATVEIFPLDDNGVNDARELLSTYIQILENNHQAAAVEHLYALLRYLPKHFVMIAPK